MQVLDLQGPQRVGMERLGRNPMDGFLGVPPILGNLYIYLYLLFSLKESWELYENICILRMNEDEICHVLSNYRILQDGQQKG